MSNRKFHEIYGQFNDKLLIIFTHDVDGVFYTDSMWGVPKREQRVQRVLVCDINKFVFKMLNHDPFMET